MSDNERVMVPGNARIVGPSASAASAGLTLAQRWTGHPVTALSTLVVSAASARRRPTTMLCSIQHMTGGPEVGGLWGGGGWQHVSCLTCTR